MSIKFDPIGEPFTLGRWVVQEEKRRSRAKRRWRVSNDKIDLIVEDLADMEDLADLLDEVLDIEEGDERAG